VKKLRETMPGDGQILLLLLVLSLLQTNII